VVAPIIPTPGLLRSASGHTRNDTNDTKRARGFSRNDTRNHVGLEGNNPPSPWGGILPGKEREGEYNITIEARASLRAQISEVAASEEAFSSGADVESKARQ
jgi:hypothetical protein